MEAVVRRTGASVTGGGSGNEWHREPETGGGGGQRSRSSLVGCTLSRVVIVLLLMGLALLAMMNLHLQKSSEHRAHLRDQHFMLEMDRLGQVSHDLQRQNERLSAQYSRAEQLLRDSEQMRDSLNNEVAAYKIKLQAAEAKLVTAEQEKEQAKLHIQQKQGLMADLQAELDSLKREVTELASACEPDEAEAEAEEELSTKEVHSTHPEGFTWVHQSASPS